MRRTIVGVVITVASIIIAILVPELFWLAIGFDLGMWASYFNIPEEIHKAIDEHFSKR